MLYGSLDNTEHMRTRAIDVDRYEYEKYQRMDSYQRMMFLNQIIAQGPDRLRGYQGERARIAVSEYELREMERQYQMANVGMAKVRPEPKPEKTAGYLSDTKLLLLE